MSEGESRSSFFRQSGWLMVATVGGGVFMTAVHSVAAKMRTEEYAVFAVLLRCLILLSIPATALQTIFAQQTAAAVDEVRRQQLAGTFRAVLAGIALLWLGMMGVVFLAEQPILNALKITNQAALWMTMLVALTSLVFPALKGLLQGDQHFLGLGWVAIIDGVGRFGAVCLMVLGLHLQSAGAMFAAVIGQGVALLVGAWWTRRLWWHAGTSPDWRRWVARVVPLTLGPGAVLVLSTADVIFVQSVFPEDLAPYYVPGAMIGFAMLQFTLPLAMVMFPKVVNSVARSEKTDALKLTLLSTLCMGGLAALAATLLPGLPLRILYFTKPDFWQMAPLVPWFAWCMLALTLVNVLVSNLIATERFAIVPWLVVLVSIYLATLFGLSDHLLTMDRDAAFRLVVQVMAGFNVLAFGLAWYFTWGRKPAPRPTPTGA